MCRKIATLPQLKRSQNEYCNSGRRILVSRQHALIVFVHYLLQQRTDGKVTMVKRDVIR